MEKKNRLKYIALVSVLCVSTLLSLPSLSAQPWQKGDGLPAAKLSPKEVTVRIIDWETYQAETLTASPVESSWVHGSSAHWEPLGNVGNILRSFGFGSVVTMAAANQNTRFGWVHFAIPTPVVSPQLQQAKLLRVLLSFDGPGAIDRIDVWDGPIQLLVMPLTLTGDHLLGGKLVMLEFSPPPTIGFGVGISARVMNFCSTEICSQQTLRFAAAGAQFIRQ